MRGIRAGLLVGICIVCIGFIFVLTSAMREAYKNTYLIHEILEQVNILELQLDKNAADYKRVSKATVEIESHIGERIYTAIQDEKLNLSKLEKKLQQVSVGIVNKTSPCAGSGVILRYHNNFYVLTAAHLITSPTDVLVMRENKKEICKLEIVKLSKEFYENTSSTDFTGVVDLLLLKMVGKEITPAHYTELSDNEPQTSEEVYTVGNPAGIEDVVSDGRVLTYKNNIMFTRTGVFFGNSGGGAYSKDGKLVGIASYAKAIPSDNSMIHYNIDGIVRLSIIKEFLEGV